MNNNIRRVGWHEHGWKRDTWRYWTGRTWLSEGQPEFDSIEQPLQTLAADQHLLGSVYGAHTLSTLGRCLDANGNGNGNGIRVELYDCSGNQAQKFVAAVTVDTIGGKRGDVTGNDLQQNCQQVQVHDCQTLLTDEQTTDQQWASNANDHTIWTLGRCVDPDGNATANGTHLELYRCNGVGGQQWLPHTNCSVLNPQSGRCLDVPSGNTANLTPLKLYDCNGQAPQVFRSN